MLVFQVRCTCCGEKLLASAAATHVCNLSALFSRCSHCGEKISLLDVSIHWCEGAVQGRTIEPHSPGSPLVNSFTNIAVAAASSSANAAFSAMDSAVECATYSGSAISSVGSAANVVAVASAGAAAVNVVTSPLVHEFITAATINNSWLLRLGYDLAEAPPMFAGDMILC